MKNVKIGVRLIAGFLMVAVLAGVIGWVSLQEIQRVNGSYTEMYDKHGKPLASLGAANAYYMRIRVHMLYMILLEDSKQIDQQWKGAQDSRDSLQLLLKQYESLGLGKEAQENLQALQAVFQSYSEQMEVLYGIAAANQDAAAMSFIRSGMTALGLDLTQKMADLLQYNLQVGEQVKESNASAVASMVAFLQWVVFGIVLLALLLGFWITRSITKPLGECVAIADQVARGDMDTHIDTTAQDETGSLKRSLQGMVTAIRAMAQDANTLSTAAVSGQLQVRADASRHAGEFQAIIMGVNRTLDALITPLHITSDCLQKISKGTIPPLLAMECQGDFCVIKDSLNTLIQVMNRLLQESERVIHAAADGLLDHRAKATEFQGSWNTLVSGINSMLDNVVQPLQQTSRYLDLIAKGEIPPRIEAEQRGQYQLIKNNLNAVVLMMEQLIQETEALVSSALAGDLSNRAECEGFVGAWKQMVLGLNRTLDAVLSPIQEASSVLDQVANRDLVVRMEGNYQGDHAKIKHALNLAVDNLEQALSQVDNASHQVASASLQISSGSQSLAQGSNEQASALEEVSASLEEMSSMTKQNAENAQIARRFSHENAEGSQQGIAAMDRMHQAIHRIKSSSDQTAKIVKTIDEIAMQTNLLALNAAVEAARAGEAGRGFAVVAEEVRNLAQRSAEAAKNTADMISDSVRNAEDGVKIASEVSQTFQGIATGVKKVNDLISEIAVASQEQSQGLDQVAKAMSEMDKLTQQNAANSEESASASEELNAQAEELQQMIRQFHIRAESVPTAGARNAHAHPPRHAQQYLHDEAPSRIVHHTHPAKHHLPSLGKEISSQIRVL